MAARSRLEGVIKAERLNAALAWILVAFLGVAVAAGVLAGDVLWAGFAGVVAALAVLPAAAFRNPGVMLPWEVLLLAALPLVGRSLTTTWLTGTFVTYLAVAAVALIIAVLLNSFTAVRMTPGFAVLFVVIATVATAGIWAVTRWVVDIAFGTAFLLDPTVPEELVETRLMWEFVYATAAGVQAGVVFEWYFRRRARLADRLPDDVEAPAE